MARPVPTADFRPGYCAIRTYWHDDVSVSWQFNSTGGTAQNMAGTWTCKLYASDTSTSAVATPTVVTTYSTAGLVTTTLASTLIAPLFAGSSGTEWNGWYDLVRVSTASAQRTWIAGPWEISRNQPR